MAHTTVSSIYSAAEDVPLILAPQFSSLYPITLPPDFNLDLPQVQNYDFKLERHIIADSEQRRHDNATITQLRAQQLLALQEERIRKQKAEARKIAPGFLDTDLRILTPVPINNTQRRASQQVESGDNTFAINSENGLDGQKIHVRSASDDIPLYLLEKMRSKEEGNEAKPAKSLVYLEFEEILSSNLSNSSNSIQDDISILREVIGSPVPTKPSNEYNSITDRGLNGSPNFFVAPANQDKIVNNPNPPRSFHPSPLLQPSVAPLPSQLSNEVFTLGSSATHSNPDLLSNKLSNLQISQNAYSTSPINIHNNTSSSIQGHRSYSAPSSSIERRSPRQPYSIPPVPPKEILPTTSPSPKNEDSEKDINPDLIEQFINMGFTKEQAVDALEKYDYDPHKATNYLLDLQ
ncbi:2489_t:CDS:2 [Funneliformis geosporum]|uniref:12783_t:CDS:1 n=1 Tax=Funneliformis geosporum TaxID=1117311 RepID=A0A9W4SIL9_9GLOM|nr:2489_t:CDS:2 [Funneliformis geosporum]CAI2170794.1 12783_t:CDS:2 [Funneliformis geosporum]